MSDEHPTLASPLTLLEEWEATGRALREFVVLGFTLDLAFLERVALRRARAAGARVTVVGDARQARHDAVDVHQAGRDYQHGHAVLPGAFHPKLAVLLGDEDVVLAVGSGNPTLSGWGHNRELWWVLRGRVDRGPRVQAEIGDWLTALPAAVDLPSWIADTLAAVGRAIGPAQVDSSHPGTHLATSLDGPLIDDLPAPGRSVDTLRLAAPFLDPSGRALTALLEHCAPDAVTLALQPATVSARGPAILRALGALPARFVEVGGPRTLHGKLVEWAVRDAVTAMVGSPNLTSAALLRAVPDGGNCELAVVGPVAGSLLPDGTSLTAAEVGALDPGPPDGDDAGPGLHLLGARVEAGDLVVEYLAPPGLAVEVEISPDGSPGDWTSAGPARADADADADADGRRRRGRVPAPVEAGSVVRLAADVDGVRVCSPVAFLTDPRRCAPRADHDGSPGLGRDYDPYEIITDPRLAERFHRELARLLELSAEEGGAPSAPAPGADRWQHFVERLRHAVGPALTGLVLPGVGAGPEPDRPGGRWRLPEDADPDERTEGEDDDAADGTEPEERLVRAVPEHLRRRQRRRVERWVRAATTPGGPGPALRMTVATLFLHLLAAGVWGLDEGWRDLLATMLRATPPRDGEQFPPEADQHLDALLAVGVATLGQDAVLGGGAPHDLLLTAAWTPLVARLARAEAGLIADVVPPSDQVDARVVGTAEVEGLVGRARDAVADPSREARARLRERGIDAVRDGGVWRVRGTGDARAVAARAVTELDDGSGIAVVASTPRSVALVLRRGARVVLALGTQQTWREFRVVPPSTVLTLFPPGAEMPRARAMVPARDVPARLGDLLAELAVDAPDLRRRLRDAVDGG